MRCPSLAPKTGGWLLALMVAAGGAQTKPVGPIPEQRSHAQCPAPGLALQAWIVEDARQWASLSTLAVEQALGRPVRWGREQLLVLALAQQPHLGVRVRLGKPWRGQRPRELQLQATVSRPGAGEAAATALSRPCVVAVLPAGRWRHVKARVEGVQVVAQRPRASEVRTGPAQTSPQAGGPIRIN